MITDNIMLAFETHHYMKMKTQGREGYAALKLDMSKAYDRVEWTLLRGIMIKFGFCVRWVNLLMECVTTVRYHILIEGDEVGPITPHRGIRRGDPLSPYMFILVAEGLTALIRNYEARGKFHGIAVPRGAPKISHLFADDSFIFFKANQEESQCCKEILQTYANASRQVINFEKSSIMFNTNVREGTREVVGNNLGGEKNRECRDLFGTPIFSGA